MRCRLQVETLHTQCLPPKGRPLRQALQTIQTSAMLGEGFYRFSAASRAYQSILRVSRMSRASAAKSAKLPARSA